jgi:Fe-S-cluster containining protein
VSDESPRKKKRGILSEETVQRPDQPDVENPYWLGEEPDEHPNPELGCIRRGLCCKSNPGTFAPGEAEKAAELLGLTPDQFVRKYLVVTSATVDGEEVPMFTPVKLGQENKPQIKPGTPADRLYYMFRGPCIFFKDNGCRIYEARPLECIRYVCTNAPEDNLDKVELARIWKKAAEDGPPEH